MLLGAIVVVAADIWFIVETIVCVSTFDDTLCSKSYRFDTKSDSFDTILYSFDRFSEKG